jgi:branched-chain amino acid aminotransferase
MGETVVERPIAIQEVFERCEKGELLEVFGTGTAAVVSPGKLEWNGKEIEVNNGKTGETTLKLFHELCGIQGGTIDDKYGWSYVVKEK